jgi:hypothetical protein
MQPRVRGLQRASDRFGHFLHREPFELVEHEHGALVFVERGKQRLELRARLGAPVRLELTRSRQMFGRIGLSTLVANVSAAPVVGCDPQANPVKPGLERRTALELAELSVHDDENLLAKILDVGFRHAEMPKRAPDVACVFIEYLAHRGSGAWSQ